MGGESKTAAATVFCRADSTFLCRSCDGKVHAVNKLASRHDRVSVCEVYEQAPAVVTCKAAAAALCPTCDRDIHSTNSLARRHERLPIVPFYDAVSPTKSAHCLLRRRIFRGGSSGCFMPPIYLTQIASWMKNPRHRNISQRTICSVTWICIWILIWYPESRRRVPLLLMSRSHILPMELCRFRTKMNTGGVTILVPSSTGLRRTMWIIRLRSLLRTTSPHPLCQNAISSSSLEVGVVAVPDHNATADVSKNDVVPTRVLGVDREARVLRYKEKRKNLKFEKTIRYAYAETRPRIKGQFAKRTELDGDS